MGVEMKTLLIGDYIVAPETIVERKSIKDLMASVFDGRLYDQCTRLKEHFEHPIILVEGNVDEIEEITDNPLVFYGALSTVVLEFKIPIIPTPSASHTAKLLVSMCSRKDAPKGPYLKKIKKSSNLETQQLSSLCSLPGIGEKFAVRMLEKFGTPLKVFSATTSELAKVEGLGEARAKKIKNMLTSKNKLQKETQQKTLT
jgi:DNA excision repair protein ERCC-4